MNKNISFPFIDNYGGCRLEIPEKKRIVFLDIDGVIAPYHNDSRHDHDMIATVNYLANKFKDDIYLKMSRQDVCAAYYDWDDLAIGRIKSLLNYACAEVVIHSDYRAFNTLETLRALFRLHAMDEYIIGKCNDHIRKEDAIKEYLNIYEDIIESYVVFDDDYNIKIDNIIYTNDYVKDEEIERAKRILVK